MLGDPAFYAVSIPGVLLYGVAKGGFGGAVAILAVPLMALVMPPAQAAAILLPILCVMDAVVVRTYWGQFDGRALRLLLPGAVFGIVLGYLTLDVMNEHWLRLLVGVVAGSFGVLTLLGLQAMTGRDHHPGTAGFFGGLAGFTSFSIHAGGPPLTMYLLPKGLPPLVFAGTAGLFFAVVNALKLLPYYLLGQFSADNLLYSLVLVPLAPIGVRVGHWLVRLSRPTVYYRIISVFLVVVGLKLCADGLTGLGAARAAMDTLSLETLRLDTPSLESRPVAGYTAGRLRMPEQRRACCLRPQGVTMQIVKLTDTVGVSGQISPADLPALAEAGYRVIVNNRPDGEAIDQPSSAEFAAAAEAAGLEYHYYPLNAYNYPGDDVGAMAGLFDDGERPVLAFCRSGTRSTNLWISSRAPQEQEAARERGRDLGFDVSMSGR